MGRVLAGGGAGTEVVVGAHNTDNSEVIKYPKYYASINVRKAILMLLLYTSITEWI